MAKKKKLKKNLIPKIAALLAFVVGVVAFIMLAAPGATYMAIEEQNFTCAQLTFGYTKTASIGSLTASGSVLDFSFGNLLIYIFLIVGLAFTVLAFLGKFGKIAPLAAAVAFVISAVLYFLIVQMCAPANSNADLVATFKDNLSLGAGAITGGVLSAVAALSCAASALLNK